MKIRTEIQSSYYSKGEKRMKKNGMKKLLTMLTALALAFAAAVSLPAMTEQAKAENVSISNYDFSAFSSSDLTPENWTKLGDANTEIFSGVYDGMVGYNKHGFSDSSVLAKDNEYKNFLVINSKQLEAYSAYSSSSVTLSASSYYQLTVKAKAKVTLNNAYFMVTGLDEEIALPIANDGAWATYKIYLATDFDESSSVNITLSFGKDEAKAMGWVMFDDVSVETMTAYDFANIEKADNILVSDLNTEYVEGMIYGGDFTVIDYDKWTVGGDKADAGIKCVPATNTTITNKDHYVTAPNYDGSENNVLQLYSTSDNGGYISIASNEFTVNPDEIYRISYFAYDENETESTGVGAVATLYYKYAGATQFKNVFANNIQTSTDATANSSHFGWVERAFYVKGSAFAPVVAKIEFALGSATSPTKGSVLIDDVRVQKITPERYDEINPLSGDVADIDYNISVDTGVTNGAFLKYNIADGKRTPSNWTMVRPGDTDVAAFGYSNAAVDTENAAFSVVNSYEEPGAGLNNYELAMKLASETDTAFGVRSASVSLSSGAYKLITVNMSAANVSGYGASIVIRQANGAVVGKIENITASQYADYKFCVKGDANVSSNLYVEIWLGMNDRDANKTKLASGEIYVKSVSATDSSADVYDAFTTSTDNNEKAVSAAADNWLGYDAYDKDMSVNNWNIQKTLGDNKVLLSVVTLDGEKVIKFQNVGLNASAAVFGNEFTISANTYYKISLKLKIEGNLDDIDTNEAGYKGVWAGVIVDGGSYDASKYYVKDIKETTQGTDSTNYLTVEFFIKGTDSEQTVSVFVGMGEDIEPKEDEEKVPYTQGTVYIKDIVFETSSTTAYTDAKNDLKNSQVLVDFGVTSDDEKPADASSSGFNADYLWLVIGSILFAVAIIVVVVVVFVKKAAKKNAKKNVVLGRPNYDRNVAGVKANGAKPENKKTDAQSGAVEEQANVDQFDDNAPAEQPSDVEQFDESAPAEQPAEEPATEQPATEEPAEENTETDSDKESE